MFNKHKDENGDVNLLSLVQKLYQFLPVVICCYTKRSRAKNCKHEPKFGEEKNEMKVVGDDANLGTDDENIYDKIEES